NKDKTTAYIGKFFYHQRNPQFLKRGNLRRNQPKSRAVAIRLLEVIAAEPRGLIHLIGKIQIATLLENFPVTRSANFAQHARGFLVRNRLVANGHDVAMHAHFRRLSLTNVQVGPAMFDNHAKKSIQLSHGLTTNDE